MALVYAALLLPLLLAGAAPLFAEPRLFGRLNAAFHAANLALAAVLAYVLAQGEVMAAGLFRVDALSGYFLLVNALVNAAAALYSSAWLEGERRAGRMPAGKARRYYVLFNLFTFTMFLVTTLDNLGLVWVAIEMTTLVSAFLVGFANDHKSVEAAWKYLILCSVGITLALLGTILFYYTLAVHAAGAASLDWSAMVGAARSLDPRIVKVAFVFILVGYGTKAGIAPLHTWLPDAHSQAPSPVSALLSGVLIKTSLYALMRFSVIANGALGPAFTGRLFLAFGLLSMAVAAAFILVQKDLKRLLAYSSIEHVGVVLVGLGIGGPLGTFGALFHVFNHAVTKSLMFFGAGEIVRKYGTHELAGIRGAARVLPFAGPFVLIGGFALAGMPPFSVFFSEFIVVTAAFTTDRYVAGGIFLVLIAAVFAGLVHHLGRVVLGPAPGGMSPERAPAAVKTVFLALFLCMTLAGFAARGGFGSLISAAAGVLR